MASADAEAIAKLVGIYDFEHAGGAFDVHLRPQGKFFAPKFQARAFWTCPSAAAAAVAHATRAARPMKVVAIF